MRSALLFVFLLPFSVLSAQNTVQWKHRAPIWFTPAKNTQIHGVSLGLVNFWDRTNYGKINGIGVELGIGILLPVGIGNAASETKPKDVMKNDTMPNLMTINGLNLSATGSVSTNTINGLSINGVGTAAGNMNGIQIAGMLCENWTLNGLSASICVNDAYRVRGAQIAMMINKSADHRGLQIGISNTAKQMRGVQIGVFNKTKKLHGLQIGLWNNNGKRSLPLVNWGGKV